MDGGCWIWRDSVSLQKRPARALYEGACCGRIRMERGGIDVQASGCSVIFHQGGTPGRVLGNSSGARRGRGRRGLAPRDRRRLRAPASLVSAGARNQVAVVLIAARPRGMAEPPRRRRPRVEAHGDAPPGRGYLARRGS